MDPNYPTQQQTQYTPSFSQQQTTPQQLPPTPQMHTSPPMHTPQPALHKENIGDKIEQMIMLSYVFVAALLMFRFALGIFGARRSPFVDFVYDISMPFMIPFAGMFGATPRAGYYSIEFEAVVAMMVYALVFFGLARMVKILFK